MYRGPRVAVLPKSLKPVLESFVEDLAKQMTISAIGFYGSWPRGGASPSGDYDIFVLAKGAPEYEVHELVDYKGQTGVHVEALQGFNLRNLSPSKARRGVEAARSVIGYVRRKWLGLIRRHLG